jgi:hypothetical protein
MTMTDNEAARLADRCWRVLEPLHALTYFAPESREAADAIGLKGWWMGYFAFRAAPLGPVPASVVRSTFFNFHKSRTDRAIPDAWALASIEAVLGARAISVAVALRRSLGDALLEETLPLLLPIAHSAASACECAGRPLAAANQSLEVSADPVAELWQLLTVLREHRGDGHIACLEYADLDGCEALVMHAVSGAVPAEILRASRNWPEDEWALAVERLRGRGLLDETGSATNAGREMRAEIEVDTNRLAGQPYAEIGAEQTERFTELLRPLARAVVRSGGFPSVNPIGLDATDQ